MPIRRDKPGVPSKKPKGSSRFRDKELAQERVAEMLCSGSTVKEAADAVGRSRSVVNGWLETPDFQIILSSRAAESAQLGDVNAKAIAVMEAALDLLLGYLTKQKTEETPNLKAVLETLRITAMKLPITARSSVGQQEPAVSGGKAKKIKFV